MNTPWVRLLAWGSRECKEKEGDLKEWILLCRDKITTIFKDEYGNDWNIFLGVLARTSEDFCIWMINEFTEIDVNFPEIQHIPLYQLFVRSKRRVMNSLIEHKTFNPIEHLFSRNKHFPHDLRLFNDMVARYRIKDVEGLRSSIKSELENNEPDLSAKIIPHAYKEELDAYSKDPWKYRWGLRQRLGLPDDHYQNSAASLYSLFVFLNDDFLKIKAD